MRRLLTVILASVPLISYAQTDTLFAKRHHFIRAVDAVGYTYTSPVRWNAKDWATVGGLLVATGTISLLDDPVKNFMGRHRSDFLDGVERIGYHYGKPYAAFAVTGGFYGVGLIIRDEWAKETGLMLASALTTSNIITGIFKNAVGRSRPITGNDNYDVVPFSDAAAHHSLPSGHTTTAFTISMILARQVNSVPLKIVFYSLATVTAASRLYTDAHWISDVAFGGGIAWFCADAAFKRLQQNRWRPLTEKRPVTVKLYPYPGGLSLRASLH